MAEEHVTLRQIDDRTKVWKCKLHVVEKRHIRTSASGVTKYQHYIFADNEVCLQQKTKKLIILYFPCTYTYNS